MPDSTKQDAESKVHWTAVLGTVFPPFNEPEESQNPHLHLSIETDDQPFSGIQCGPPFASALQGDKNEDKAAGLDVVTSRVAKLADAAWSMRTKSQRNTTPELQKYQGKHVAVFEQRIVAFGDDYAEVLHRSMAECGVPYHRIIMDYWGNPARFQSLLDDDDV